MSLTSTGILVYRRRNGLVDFLLGHPGGPLWSRRDGGVWTAPKGLVEAGEDFRGAAIREFEEETGLKPPPLLRPLEPVRQANGKRVICFAAEGDLDLAGFSPGVFEMEWPPRSGRRAAFPELDRVAYFEEREARLRILPYQAPFIGEVLVWLREAPGP